MKVKFKSGNQLNCTNPIEQKVFRNGNPAGWACSFVLTDATTSAEVDTILTENNISEITFYDDNLEVIALVTGYSKLSSAVVRYTESNTTVDIQITKGV